MGGQIIRARRNRQFLVISRRLWCLRHSFPEGILGLTKSSQRNLLSEIDSIHRTRADLTRGTGSPGFQAAGGVGPAQPRPRPGPAVLGKLTNQCKQQKSFCYFCYICSWGPGALGNAPEHHLSPMNKDNTSRCVLKNRPSVRPSVRPSDRPSVRPSVHPTGPFPLHIWGNGMYATLLLKGFWGLTKFIERNLLSEIDYMHRTLADSQCRLFNTRYDVTDGFKYLPDVALQDRGSGCISEPHRTQSLAETQSLADKQG